MNRLTVILAVVAGLFLQACVSTSDLTPSQSALATLAIKAGTVELITENPDNIQETAAKVIEIATETLSLVDSGAVTIIDDLDSEIRSRISKLSLSTEKAIIVDTLLTMVNAEIKYRIGDQVLNPDTVVTLSAVLEIIIDTSESYE